MSNDDKAPRVVALEPLRGSTALKNANTWKNEVARWDSLIRSGALPKHVRTPEMAITLARAGEIYGWDPIRSLRSLFMVEGKVEMWAQDMLGLIREKCPEATVQPVEISAERVVIRVSRPPQMPETFDVTVTADQFRHLIKKTSKGNESAWQLYTEDLLWARCVSRIGRRFFSDVVAGAYTVGEIHEAEFTVRQPAKRGAVEYVEPPSLDQDVPDPAPASEVDTEPPVDADVVDGPEDEPANDPETVVTLDPNKPMPGDEDAP